VLGRPATPPNVPPTPARSLAAPPSLNPALAVSLLPPRARSREPALSEKKFGLSVEPQASGTHATIKTAKAPAYFMNAPKKN